MKNNLLVRFSKAKWFFALWCSILLLITLVFYRAFGLEPGVSASGHPLWIRGLSYALVVFGALFLVEYSFDQLARVYRRLLQFLVSYYLVFCTLNFFWFGIDWQWSSATSLFIDYSLFWLPVLFLDWLFTKSSSKSDFPLAIRDKLIFKDEQGKTELRIRANDLRYIKSDGNYVEVFYQDENQLQRKLLRQKLKNCLEEYPQDLFQIHRSYLVAPAAIEEVFWHSKQASLELKGGVKLKIGQAFQQDLKSHLSKAWNLDSHS